MDVSASVSRGPELDIVPPDDAEKARVFRKAITRLVPLLTISFIISYIDRTNIGFAALTMNRDLGLSASQFGWGAGILFFSYCFFEVPSNMALFHFGARRWIARIMITWGLLSAGTALVSGAWSFYVLRFMLGIAEAGFTPGVMFFFALWFPVQYRSRILAWFQLAVPVASLISGPLSTGILLLDGAHGLAGWQWLFILEGIPAVLLGIAVLVVVSDTPRQARWLTPREQDVVEWTLAAERRDKPVRNMRAAFQDPRVLILAGIQFGFTIGSYGVAIWLPLILKGHDLSNVAVGFLSSLPYLCGAVATITWAAAVDRNGKRIGNLALACLVGAIGLVISIAFGSLEMSLMGMCVALVGITSARGIFWSIPPRFLTGLGAAGGLAFINSIGTFGGFVGPVVMGWLKDATGSFGAGLGVMAGLIVVSSLLTLSLRRFMTND